MRPLLALAVLGSVGCATAKPCKPLSPFYIGGVRIFPVVCSRDHIVKACQYHPPSPDLSINACCYARTQLAVGKPPRRQCWIFSADDEAGAKATHHEYAHCAGHDEAGARCDDWPGTDAPPGQECKDGWRRRDAAKEK